MSDIFSCPRCLCEVRQLHEGHCATCCEQRQADLDEHNERYDQWQRKTAAERERAIKGAMQ